MSDELPVVSVVIPTYNAEPFLREALDSVISQLYTQLEIICVNDGSKDNSLEIIREYEAKDSRIKVIDQPNGGYGKAMNAGMGAATGKYMAIFEPDDYLPPHAYKSLVDLAEKNNLDIAKGCICRFYETRYGRKKEYDHNVIPRVLMKPSEDLKAFDMSMFTPTCLYNLEFLRKHNIRYNETPGAAYQDAGMHKLSFAYAERLMCTSDIVYCYRIDNPNSSTAAGSISRQPYAHRKEYDYIIARLQETPEVWEKVKGVVMAAKIRGFFWIYNSVSPYEKKEFVESFRDELRNYPSEAFEVLDYIEKMKINEIMISADGFMMAEIISSRLRISQNEIIRQVKACTGAARSSKQNEQHSIWSILFYQKLDNKKIIKFMGIPIITAIKKKGYRSIRILGIRIMKYRIKK